MQQFTTFYNFSQVVYYFSIKYWLWTGKNKLLVYLLFLIIYLTLIGMERYDIIDDNIYKIIEDVKYADTLLQKKVNIT